MKNTILKTVSAIVLAATLFVFTGCEKEQDEISQTEIQQSQITPENLISGKISVEDLTTEQKIYIISQRDDLKFSRGEKKSYEEYKSIFNKVVLSLSDEDLYTAVIQSKFDQGSTEEENWSAVFLMQEAAKINFSSRSNDEEVKGAYIRMLERLNEKGFPQDRLKNRSNAKVSSSCPQKSYTPNMDEANSYNRSPFFVTRADNNPVWYEPCDFEVCFFGTSNELYANTQTIENLIQSFGGYSEIIYRFQGSQTRVLIGSIRAMMHVSVNLTTTRHYLINNVKLKV